MWRKKRNGRKIPPHAAPTTNLFLKDKQPNCLLHSDNSGWYTSPKQGQVYQINWGLMLASRIIGKGCTGLHISRVQAKFFRTLKNPKELCTENMKMVVENAKKLVQEEKGLHIDENMIDISNNAWWLMV